MADTTLSMDLTKLREEVVQLIGGGRDYSVLSADTQAMVTEIIDSGYRRFLFPTLPKGTHFWSFLRPRASMTLNAAYSTGTVTVVAGVVTLASGTFPSWAAAGVVTISNISYEVSTRDSDTQVTLTDTSVAESAGTSYVLDQRDYDLPDDFGGMTSEGNVVYADATHANKTIKIVAEEALVRMRVERFASAAPPFLAAIRHKTTDGTAGQRSQLLLYPAPESAHELFYRYDVLPNRLTEAAPYPYGGATYAELLKLACLATAEEYADGVQGMRSQSFQRELGAAVQADLGKTRVSLGYLDDRGVSPFGYRPDQIGCHYMPEVTFS